MVVSVGLADREEVHTLRVCMDVWYDGKVTIGYILVVVRQCQVVLLMHCVVGRDWEGEWCE